jgi:enoyl-CoA hydratase
VSKAVEFQQLLFDKRNYVATVTLNRPEKLNTFTPAMKADFERLYELLRTDPDVRVVVFVGAGRAFSAGADLDWIAEMSAGPAFRSEYREMHNVFDDLEALEKPVLAQLHGLCVGGGLKLALSCDFRIAAEDARLGFREGNVGLIPGSGGCSRLVKLVGPAHAKRLVFTGDLIPASEALEMGLVDRVVPSPELPGEVRRMADTLAAKAPQALAIAKQVIQTCLNSDTASGRFIERLGQSILIQSDDHREGLRAFKEKRPPRFSGR